MELKKIDKKMLILALKIAIGTSAAMFIAQALHLQNAGSAGTIALLTIMTTKWETVRLTVARIVTFAIAVLLVILIFANIHIAWLDFGIYIFFIVLVCEFLGWKSTISVNSVIGTHFLVAQDFSPEFIFNEFLLVLIGTIAAFIVNSFSHNKSRQKKLVANITYVESQLQMILKELAYYLQRREMKADVWDDIRNLEAHLKNLIVDAYEYEGNTFMTHTGYFAICGAKGCIRACMNMLEKADRIENKFHNRFYYKKSWTLPNKPEQISDGVNPYREEYLDKNYPGVRENEYQKTE